MHTQNGCNSLQSVRAKMIFKSKGIFEWDIIVESASAYSWVGVCASGNFDYEYFAGGQPTGWVLGSSALLL